MNISDKFHTLIEIADYGLRWIEDFDNPTEGIEVIAHQIACCICQWYNINQGVPTCETRDYLELEKFPSKETLTVSLMRYITLLQKESIN